MFQKPAHSDVFLRVPAEGPQEQAIRLPAFVRMPDHAHFVLQPEGDGDLSVFCRRLAHAHRTRHTARIEPIDQGRFKAFGAASGEHLDTVCR